MTENVDCCSITGLLVFVFVSMVRYLSKQRTLKLSSPSGFDPTRELHLCRDQYSERQMSVRLSVPASMPLNHMSQYTPIPCWLCKFRTCGIDGLFAELKQALNLFLRPSLSRQDVPLNLDITCSGTSAYYIYNRSPEKIGIAIVRSRR